MILGRFQHLLYCMVVKKLSDQHIIGHALKWQTKLIILLKSDCWESKKNRSSTQKQSHVTKGGCLNPHLSYFESLPFVSFPHSLKSCMLYGRHRISYGRQTAKGGIHLLKYEKIKQLFEEGGLKNIDIII